MYYLITNSGKLNSKCKVINTKEKLNVNIFDTIKENSIVFTDVDIDNNKIKWFNNSQNYENNELNKLITNKNLKLIKILKIENNNFNIIDFIIDLKENFIEMYDLNGKPYDMSKNLKEINNLIIMGNGPEICSGEKIDSFDYVVRVNNCIIKKDITGGKTDFYFKGGSHASPDFDNMDFNSGKITCLTNDAFIKRTAHEWINMDKVYGNCNLNWYELFKTLNFKYFDHNILRKFFKKWKIGTSGILLICLFMKLNLSNNYKLSITGFSDYSKHLKWVKSFNEVDNKAPIHKSHYLFPDEQIFTTKFNYNKELLLSDVKTHNYDNIKYFLDILHLNEIIFKA